MNTSDFSMDNLGGKISSVIYPKSSMEDLNNCSNICYESNDGKSCDCITTKEHLESCNKNRPSSLMFDGIKIVRVAKPNKNWIRCKCGMAIRNEHQHPAKPKLTYEQMYGKMRIYQGSIPRPSPDVEAVIRWQAHLVRGTYDEEVKARQNASSSSTVKRERVQRAKWLAPVYVSEPTNLVNQEEVN